MGTNTGREYLVMRNLSKATLQGLSALLGASRNLNDQLQQEEWATCLKDISLGSKITVMTAQRDYLKKLQRKKMSTPEIRKLARLVTRKGRGERSKRWEQLILQERIAVKSRELKDLRKKWLVSSQEAERIFQEGRARSEYRRLKKSELNTTWSKQRGRLQTKFKNKAVVPPPSIDGICLTDQGLQAKFGDRTQGGLVLHGIEPSNNVLEFLKLPPKFKVYKKVDLIEARVEGEATAAKQRYSRLEDEKQQVSQEQRLDRRWTQAQARAPHKDGIANFQRMKAREFKSNKRIGQPEDRATRGSARSRGIPNHQAENQSR